jgi:hypothetical protein
VVVSHTVSGMTRSRRTSQVLASLLAAATLALAGCSGDSGDTGSEGSSDSSGTDDSGSSSAANEFSALGVSFEAPEGWEALDADDTGVSEENSGEIAEGLGMTAEQLTQAV